MRKLCEVVRGEAVCGLPATRTLRVRMEPIGKGDIVFCDIERNVCDGHSLDAQRAFGSPEAVDALLSRPTEPRRRGRFGRRARD